jgi:hypothetical protein
MSNIFDIEKDTPEPVIRDVPTSRQKSGIASFIAGTFTLAVFALIAPIYIHVLVKIATWSWNLI